MVSSRFERQVRLRLGVGMPVYQPYRTAESGAADRKYRFCGNYGDAETAEAVPGT